MKNKYNYLLFGLLITFSFSSCEDDPEPVLLLPTIENVEVGLNNNETGLIGRDFHFNADVVAGDKIEDVQIKIVQRPGENYGKDWNFEMIWIQYSGAKNTNIHSHFEIPVDASEGVYDFLIIVNDQNGTTLEEKRSITIRDPENLPVDPSLSEFLIGRVGGDVLYYLSQGGYYNPATQSYGGTNEQTLLNGEELRISMNVANVKDDGIMYVLLINKKHNHRPESIERIEYDKTIVLDVYEHHDKTEIGSFFNYTGSRPKLPHMIIGSEQDNNIPPSAISNLKAWESGEYHLGLIYHNTTHNMGVFQYIDVSIAMD